MPNEMGMSKEMGMSSMPNGHGGGHLYMQTNETHAAGRQADRERSGRKERHGQIVGILSFEGHALRGPLLWTRSYPAHVGLQ